MPKCILGIEYWQYTHPVSEETTCACAPDGEDPTCSACIPSKGINPAHWTVCPKVNTRSPSCVLRLASDIVFRDTGHSTVLPVTEDEIILCTFVFSLSPAQHDLPGFTQIT